LWSQSLGVLGLVGISFRNEGNHFSHSINSMLSWGDLALQHQPGILRKKPRPFFHLFAG
jgi:hypothetical protein